MPSYNLIAQSIELSLKAYLLSKGLTSRRLREQLLRHNLDGLMAKAEGLGLNDLVSLDDLDRQLVSGLSRYYEAHEFRYIKTGAKELPFWSLISPLAKRFTHELHDYCLVLLIGEADAHKRIETCGKF
ncbi:hypothetical protein RHOFW104T7_07405 [Rhodanobacter thiooxydans]|uniref:Uncharacterized protein n=2 Tax=Rhodanobacter thiooxydans TaxID=416169 RepID=A0A154QJZ4_9GAMM|nr:hypothetical protein UUA_15558 [Rhodanobacter thiooxydans LCS2]KZC24637.1 hypothetical protein RHOFW104T7_07405 [Rhodanobacter thiooxydans]